ncbi:MAG: type II toxin-antitoxin system Phd/YefM family antitoxin [Firmicutes bacterium]|nr:type II toxin-antitoxin system Phd/YefM family antitoxin [Bacillota bacterium]
MHITNITEIRRHASRIVARVVKEKEPAVVLQRSKPVAYILEASVYDDMQRRLREWETSRKEEQTREGMEAIETVRRQMALRRRQPDSTPMIRKIREGLRNE